MILKVILSFILGAMLVFIGCPFLISCGVVIALIVLMFVILSKKE